MRTSLVLTNKSYQSFFWASDKKVAICVQFVSKLFGEPLREKSIKLSLSTKNPKKKGWAKIKWPETTDIFVGEKYFVLCGQEQKFLSEFVKVGDCFWLKIDLLE